MSKAVIGVIGALLALLLLAVPAGAQELPPGVVLPGPDGECPLGFTLGYSDELGEICTEDLERDGAITPAAGALPRTGGDSLPLARIGLILVAVGGLAVLVARKRQAVTRSA